MAARAIWKGTIRIGKAGVPVKLYAAVNDAAVHFHLLHDHDGVRVKQRMVNPRTNEPVDPDEIHLGFEAEPGTFVLVTEEERKRLEPPPSRDIEVHGFVPPGAIEPAWYDRPYYLGPDSKSEPYFALVEALTRRERIGIVHWAMRGRKYHGALRPEGKHLVLVTLHALVEVVRAPKIAPAARHVDARELKMAEQLVAALTAKFEPSDFENEHTARVRELVQAKARGKTIRSKPVAPRRPSRSLTAALSASLKQVDEKHAEKERRSA